VQIDTTPPEAAMWPQRQVTVAGGIVLRHGRVLLLRRAPGGVLQVRLPKGKIERGETAEQAALREAREESGLRAPCIVAPLGQWRTDSRMAVNASYG
jgi:8-oxo-dGTP pyrophosphatase MutT (NUDIX family)